jgi:hypothetical protein
MNSSFQNQGKDRVNLGSNGPEVHTASYLMRTGQMKTKREADHRPPPNAVNNAQSVGQSVCVSRKTKLLVRGLQS